MICCQQCKKHSACIKKWILGERGLPQTCCFECSAFFECLDGNMKKRWEIIHRADDWNAVVETAMEGSS